MQCFLFLIHLQHFTAVTEYEFVEENFFFSGYREPSTEPECLTFKEPKNRFQVTNSARLCSLAGRYDNPIPPWFLAPIDCLKIPAEYMSPEPCLVYGERRRGARGR